mgnify:CR=1 FL=1
MFDRTKGLGSTDVAAICGVHPYMSDAEVYNLKLGISKGPETSEAMYWGLALEDAIAQRYAEDHGETLLKVDPVIHPKHPWAFCSPDRLIDGQEKGVEIKTTGTHNRKRWDNDQIPQEYLIQIHWMMLCLGYRQWAVAALIGGQRYIEQEVEYDERLGDAIFKKAHDFWHNHIKRRIPPPIDDSAACSQALLERYPGPTSDELREANKDEAGWVQKLVDAKERYALCKKDVARFENNLKNAIGENRGIQGSDFKATWTPITNERTDWKGLCQKLSIPPKLKAAHTTTTTSRRFVVKT